MIGLISLLDVFYLLCEAIAGFMKNKIFLAAPWGYHAADCTSGSVARQPGYILSNFERIWIFVLTSIPGACNTEPRNRSAEVLQKSAPAFCSLNIPPFHLSSD